MKGVVFVIIFCFFSRLVFAQQSIPSEMLFNPQEAKFSMSGVGGGNLYEFNTNKSSASGQVATDFVIKVRDDYDKYKGIVTSVKFNPTSYTKYRIGDTIDMKKIAFVNNQYLGYLGLKYSVLHNAEEDDKLVHTFFYDASISVYNVENSSFNNKGFYNFNMLLGAQLGYTTNTDFGIVALLLSLQGNYINIYDLTTDDSAFDELLGSSYRLSRNYYGWGGKLTFQINDFALYFELKRYYSDNKTTIIKDFSNRAIFSIGGVATGTIFRNKKY